MRKMRYLLLVFVLCLGLASPGMAADDDFTIVDGVLTWYDGSDSEVTIPDGVTVIGESAFQQCEVEKVHIPDSVTRIEWDAFGGSDLTEITIPSSVTEIELSVFDGCLNLPAIHVDPKNPNYMDIDGVLFSKDGKLLHTYPAGKQVDSYSIPDGVTELGECAFYYSSLGSITIPNSVTVIGDQAFSCCKNLTDVIIPEGVTQIGGWAFIFCEKLTHINIPNSVTSLGDHAFLGCDGLTAVTIPGSITSIRECTFMGCESLTDVTILPGVTSIEETAFIGCRSLSNVTIPDSVTQIGESAFDGARGNISNVYYSGSEEQWNAINMGAFNYRLTNATMYYNYVISTPDTPTVPDIPDMPIAPDMPDIPTVPAAPIIIAKPITTVTPDVIAFEDVKATDYFSDSVKWAVGKNIISGTSDTTFSPHDHCTIGEVLTFLWRAKGEPSASIDNPFSDVSTGDYYYKAALWAYEKGLVSGNSFGGDTLCTRAQTVIYQWKLAGSPLAPATSFTDVSISADYAVAVAWAVQKGVTAGTSDTTFSPNDTCTRGQIVTFLYRDLA